MVAVDKQGKPILVPRVILETEEEKMLYDSAPERKKHRTRPKPHYYRYKS